MTKETHIRKLARMYRDGDSVAELSYHATARYEGAKQRQRALNIAADYGITKDELLDEVAQIDIEEEEVK